MKLKPIRSVATVKDPYSKRILSYLIGRDAFAVYSRTPQRIQRLLRGLSVSRIRKPPREGKWSIAQIINHLYDSELVIGFRYRMVLAQPGSRLQAFDESRWAERLHYASSNPKKKLALFIAMRNDHVVLLRTLSARDWQAWGAHEERGRETIRRMVQMMAGHDINHLKQIEAIRKNLHLADNLATRR